MHQVQTFPKNRLCEIFKEKMCFVKDKDSKFAGGLKFQQQKVQTELSLGNGTQVVPTPPFKTKTTPSTGHKL